jgi:hypothetical protein
MIKGTVALPDGTPLTGATVHLDPSFWAVTLNSDRDAVATLPSYVIAPSSQVTTTDDQGRFKFQAAPSLYFLSVVARLDGGTPAVVAHTEVQVTGGEIATINLTAIAPPSPVNDQTQWVSQITALSFQAEVATNSIPPSIGGNLVASGTVSSGGWTNPRLIARASNNPALLEFDFVADPPPAGTVSAAVLTSVAASVPLSYRGALPRIVVYAQTDFRQLN